MRQSQFWILLLCSSLVSILLIKQIFVSRALEQEQRLLVDCQETASTETGYENAWKQLAIHMYQASHQDPALVQLLKSENVEIHQKSDTDTNSASATPPSVPPIPSKTPASSHPAIPSTP